jgi:cell division protein FtsX
MEILVALASFLSKHSVTSTATELFIIGLIIWVIYLLKAIYKQNIELKKKITLDNELRTTIYNEIEKRLEHVDEVGNHNYIHMGRDLEKLSKKVDIHHKDEADQHADIGKTVNEVNKEIGKISATVMTAISYSNKPIK